MLEIEDIGDDADKAFHMGAVLIRLAQQLRLAHRHYRTYSYIVPAGNPSTAKQPAGTSTYLLQLSKDENSCIQTDWCHDPGSRLAKPSRPAVPPTPTTAAPRPATATSAKASTLTFNTSNEISTSGWSYDHNGNLTADPSNGTLAYNDAGQLISASATTGGGGTSATKPSPTSAPGRTSRCPTGPPPLSSTGCPTSTASPLSTPTPAAAARATSSATSKATPSAWSAAASPPRSADGGSQASALIRSRGPGCEDRLRPAAPRAGTADSGGAGSRARRVGADHLKR